MANKREAIATSTTANSLTLQKFISIFPCSHETVQWYHWWLYDQIQRQPRLIFSTLQGCDSKKDDGWMGPLLNMWQEISQYMIAATSVKIDDVVAHLLESDILELGSDQNALIAAKYLVFAVIGWQTMLYQADIHSCPPDQLAIQNEMGAHMGLARMCLKQSQSVCRRELHEFLLGYGLLLPPRNFDGLGSPEEKKALTEFKSVAPASFNASILSSIGDVTIEWVDSLSCHMEFDSYLNKLFIFRYPSFCLANIPSEESRHSPKSAIYACAASWGSTEHWATTYDVTQMLQETILSYRLLFGQNNASRQLFQKLKPFENIPRDGRDLFLNQLCGKKCYPTVSNGLERESYDLPRDFPILRNRLVALLCHLSTKKPRTCKELWEDNRDSASWLTFWAVLIIGGLGLILALLQTILQIVQVTQH